MAVLVGGGQHSTATRLHSFGWSWRWLSATLCLLHIQHGKPPPSDLPLDFTCSRERVRELSNAGIPRKFWEWEKKNLTMLYIKHRIIQKIDRFKDIRGIRISFFFNCITIPSPVLPP